MEACEQAWRPEDVAVAGVVLTLAPDGSLRMEQGFVRPEDEPKPEPAAPTIEEGEQDGADAGGAGRCSDFSDAPAGGEGSAWPMPVRGIAGATVTEPEHKASALSAALLGELEAHRTAGLQAELSRQPELALRVLLHALATDVFYARYGDTVARFTSYPPALASACPGIADSPARQAMADAEQGWRTRLPGDLAALWPWLQEQDTPALLGLLAVCVARTADAGRADWTAPQGAGCIQARVAQAAGLDMRRWRTATPDAYLARVPKALILDAVREGASGTAAHQLRDVRKEVMVADAATLLDGKGWLPRVLRVPGGADEDAAEATAKAAEAREPAAFEAGTPALPQAAE